MLYCKCRVGDKERIYDMDKKRLIFATTNQGKMDEIRMLMYLDQMMVK